MVQYALRDLCGFKNLEWYADNYEKDMTSFDIRRFGYDVKGRFDEEYKHTTDKNEFKHMEILNEVKLADTKNYS